MVPVPGGCQGVWQRTQVGRQVGRQGVKGMRKKEGGLGWERASGPRPPSLSARFLALPESGKTHPVCLRVGKSLFFFFKNSFLQSIKKKKISEKNFSKSSLLTNIWHRQWGRDGWLWPRLFYCYGPAWPTHGLLPASLLSHRQLSRRQGPVSWLRRCPWVPVWKLKSLVAGKGLRR